MSIHEDIQQTIRGIIVALEKEGVDILSPTMVATRTYEQYGDTSADAHVRYLCVEHAKQMARRILGARFGVDGEENEVHQADMFSGLLQERYPTRKEKDQDAGYKLRHLMTDAELLWVADQLGKSAIARKEHQRAIRAYVKSRTPLEPAKKHDLATVGG